MKVIMLSKTFPSVHPRAGQPTGFMEKFLAGKKIHTLRENRNGYYKDGDVVSVRRWSGIPYRSKQIVIADGVKIGVVPVRIRLYSKRFSGPHGRFQRNNPNPIISVGEKIFYCPYFSGNDGLEKDDFLNWFFQKGSRHGDVWDGDIIHFADFRY